LSKRHSIAIPMAGSEAEMTATVIASVRLCDTTMR
jgi:hypothetical protein